MKDRYTDAEMLYSAGARCDCGAGLAYPLDHADAQQLGAWVCSRVLRGEAEIPPGVSDPGAGIFKPVERLDTMGQKHTGLPFAFFEVKSEGQPSAHGASTRPAGSHIEAEPHGTCRGCGHVYIAARRRHDNGRRNEGLDCPSCGAKYLGDDGSLAGRIDVRTRYVVVADAPASPSPITDAELTRVLADCERCPFDVDGNTPEARVWRDLHRVAIELQARRAAEPPVPALARVAFDAYNKSTGGKTHDGKDIPPFEAIRERAPHVVTAWEAAVSAVLNATQGAIPC